MNEQLTQLPKYWYCQRNPENATILNKWNNENYLGGENQAWSDTSNVSKIVDLTEIRQYLPDNHFDKIEILKYKDLIIGEVYLSIMPKNPKLESLHLCVNDSQFKLKNRLYISSDYQFFCDGEYGEHSDDLYRKATPHEKQWFNLCVEQNKFIPMPEFKNQLYELW